MATTTTTTPNAPNLLTLVTDSESIVSSIDTLTSYLDSELAPSTVMGPAPTGDPVSFAGAAELVGGGSVVGNKFKVWSTYDQH